MASTRVTKQFTLFQKSILSQKIHLKSNILAFLYAAARWRSNHIPILRMLHDGICNWKCVIDKCLAKYKAVFHFCPYVRQKIKDKK